MGRLHHERDSLVGDSDSRIYFYSYCGINVRNSEHRFNASVSMEENTPEIFKDTDHCIKCLRAKVIEKGAEYMRKHNYPVIGKLWQRNSLAH